MKGEAPMYDDRFECHDWGTDGYPGEYIYWDDTYVDDYYMDERWLPVPECPNDYYISTKGRLWSVADQCFYYGYEVKSKGYREMSLTYDDKKHRKLLHQIMGETFLDNPKGYPLVRHLDDDGSNNEIENLEWGDQLMNVHDCIRNGHFKYFSEYDREKAMQKRRMPIVAVNIRTGEKTHFQSQQEASRKLNVDQSSIWAVLNNKKEHVQGWYFVKEGDIVGDLSRINTRRYGKKLPIRAFNIDTGEDYVYRGMTSAANDLGMSVSSVSMVLNGKMKSCKGWIFEYVDEEGDRY